MKWKVGDHVYWVDRDSVNCSGLPPDRLVFDGRVIHSDDGLTAVAIDPLHRRPPIAFVETGLLAVNSDDAVANFKP